MKPTTNHKPQTPLLIILALYLALGTIYSIVTPILEPPDEVWHYPYVRHVAAHRRFPPRDPHALWGQQSTQPPLYYLTAALATAWVDADDFEDLLRYNPFWGYPAAGTVNDNKNRVIHTADEAFPWRGAVLAIHLARFVNLAFGALTVWATWLLARELLPRRRWLWPIAAALVAFNPQFLFISAAVSNDPSAAATSTLALWLLLRGLRRGFAPRRSLLTGSLIGLAMLCKSSAIALLPLAAVAVVLSEWLSGTRQPDWRRTLRPLLIVLGAAALVAGWWFVRSALLYDDPFSIGGHLKTWWAHEEPLTPAELWAQLPQVELSFWAGFGWGNVRLPDPFYWALWLVVRLAVLGLLLMAWRRWRAGPDLQSPRLWGLALLAAWFALVFVALLRWMQLVEAALGRLLFPAIGSTAILLALGLGGLVPRRYAAWPGRALAGCLFVTALLTPWLVIRPAYVRPTAIDPAAPPTAQPLDLRFSPESDPSNAVARLLGYSLTPGSAHPGDELRVKLCWQALSPVEADYPVFMHLVGRGEQVVGRRDTHPGLGSFPTSLWQPGSAFCDLYRLPIEHDAPTPVVYQLQAGLYEFESGERLVVTDGAGNSLDAATLAAVKLAPRQWPNVAIPHKLERELGGQIALSGYTFEDGAVSPGDSLHYTLFWRALAASPSADYTVFVHLRSASGDTLVHGDGQPTDGLYPSSFWSPGETVVDERALTLPPDLPPGEYTLVVGLYRLDTLERLLLPDGGSEIEIPTKVQVR